MCDEFIKRQLAVLFKYNRMSAHVFSIPVNVTLNDSSAATPFNTVIQNQKLINIVYYVIAIFGVALNVFTIVIIYLYKPLHKQVTIVFIVNQSVIDALASLFLILSTLFPNDYARRRYGSVADEMLCRIWFSNLPMWSLLVRVLRSDKPAPAMADREGGSTRATAASRRRDATTEP